jgi:hypothetical protein
MNKETCSRCGTKTKCEQYPVIESPKDHPHNEPFCYNCLPKDYEPEVSLEEIEEARAIENNGR